MKNKDGVQYRILPDGKVVIPKKLLRKWCDVWNALIGLERAYDRATIGFKAGDFIICLNPQIIQQYLYLRGDSTQSGTTILKPTEPGIIIYPSQDGSGRAILTFTNDGETPSSTFRAKLQPWQNQGVVIDLDRLDKFDWNTDDFSLFNQVATMRKQGDTEPVALPPRCKERREYKSTQWGLQKTIEGYQEIQPKYARAKRHLLPFLRRNRTKILRAVRILRKRYGIRVKNRSLNYMHEYKSRTVRPVKTVFTKPHHHVKTEYHYWKHPTAPGVSWYTLAGYSSWLGICEKWWNRITEWRYIIDQYTTYTQVAIAKRRKEYEKAVYAFNLRKETAQAKYQRKLARIKKRGKQAQNLMDDVKYDYAVNRLKSLVYDLGGEKHLAEWIEPKPKDEAKPQKPKEPWQMTEIEMEMIITTAAIERNEKLVEEYYKHRGYVPSPTVHKRLSLQAEREVRQQMLGRDFYHKRDRFGHHFPSMNEIHRLLVSEALAEGKPVPPEVLAEYPDLVAKAEPTAHSQQPTTEALVKYAERTTKGPGRPQHKIGDVVQIKDPVTGEIKREGRIIARKRLDSPFRLRKGYRWGYKLEGFGMYFPDNWVQKPKDEPKAKTLDISTPQNAVSDMVSPETIDKTLDISEDKKEAIMAQEETKPVAMDGEVIALVGDIVVIRTSYKGKEKIDVRRVYENGDGKWHPSKQGIRLTKGQWAQILEALTAAVAA